MITKTSNFISIQIQSVEYKLYLKGQRNITES